MGRLPSVPDELLEDVQATTWWLGDTWPGVNPELLEASDVDAQSLARRPVTVSPETPLELVARELADTGATVLVVVDERNIPLGVVTAAHVMRCVGRLSRWQIERATAIDASTSGGALIPASSPLAVAARMLAEDDRAFGVVVDGDGHLVGTLTASGILRALDRHGRLAPRKPASR